MSYFFIVIYYKYVSIKIYIKRRIIMSKLKKVMLIKQEMNIGLLKAIIILKDNDWSYRKTMGLIKYRIIV